MRYRFIGEHRSGFGVEKMCRVMKVSRSGYYAWSGRPPSRRQGENESLLAAIRDVHGPSRGTYGSPRIQAELVSQGFGCGRNRVARLMRQNSIRAGVKRRFKSTTQSKHGYPIAPDLVRRDFTVAAPNRVWAADLSYIDTAEGWLYLAVILDLYSRQVVGWSMKERLTSAITVDALLQALRHRQPPGGLIVHSDRGGQFACDEFRRLLAAAGAVGSMSRSGDCYDNACAESFFGTLKTELVYRRRYRDRSEARRSIFEYIEVFYNRQRRHSTLGYKSPVEFEQLKP